MVALVYGETRDAQRKNARLIAEAGTVYSESGLSPRALLEQRDCMLQFIKFVDLWMTRKNVTDDERLSAIRHHPSLAPLAALRVTGSPRRICTRWSGRRTGSHRSTARATACWSKRSSLRWQRSRPIGRSASCWIAAPPRQSICQATYTTARYTPL